MSFPRVTPSRGRSKALATAAAHPRQQLVATAAALETIAGRLTGIFHGWALQHEQDFDPDEPFGERKSWFLTILQDGVLESSKELYAESDRLMKLANAEAA